MFISSEVLIHQAMFDSKTDTLELEWSLNLQIFHTLQRAWKLGGFFFGAISVLRLPSLKQPNIIRCQDSILEYSPCIYNAMHQKIAPIRGKNIVFYALFILYGLSAVSTTVEITLSFFQIDDGMVSKTILQVFIFMLNQLCR